MSAASPKSETGEHVSPLTVLLIAFAMAFVVAWFTGAAMLLVTVIAYGLFGAEIFLPIGRVVAFAFSAVFVVVALAGWRSWIWVSFCARRAAARQQSPEKQPKT